MRHVSAMLCIAGSLAAPFAHSSDENTPFIAGSIQAATTLPVVNSTRPAYKYLDLPINADTLMPGASVALHPRVISDTGYCPEEVKNISAEIIDPLNEYGDSALTRHDDSTWVFTAGKGFATVALKFDYFYVPGQLQTDTILCYILPGPNSVLDNSNSPTNTLTATYPCASSFVHLSIPNDIAAPIQIRIVNPSGRTIYQSILQTTGIHDIPISNTAPGFYILQLTGRTFSSTHKFFIAR